MVGICGVIAGAGDEVCEVDSISDFVSGVAHSSPLVYQKYNNNCPEDEDVMSSLQYCIASSGLYCGALKLDDAGDKF